MGPNTPNQGVQHECAFSFLRQDAERIGCARGLRGYGAARLQGCGAARIPYEAPVKPQLERGIHLDSPEPELAPAWFPESRLYPSFSLTL